VEKKKKEVNQKKNSQQCSTDKSNLISKERQTELICESMLKKFKIPKRFKNKGFDNYDTDQGDEKAFKAVKNYANNFEEHFKKGHWLILTGGYGLGKTHLAIATAKDCLNYFAAKEAERSRSTIYSGMGKVMFISSSEMIQAIRDSYDSKVKNEQELMNKYKNTPVLIIDDLGTEKSSEWQREKMYIVLNHRYNELLPTIITTNLDAGDLFSHVSERVVERMIEAAGKGKYLLNFEGKSYRRLRNE